MRLLDNLGYMVESLIGGEKGIVVKIELGSANCCYHKDFEDGDFVPQSFEEILVKITIKNPLGELVEVISDEELDLIKYNSGYQFP